MQPDSIIIVQSNIPISTAAPTHYVRFQHTHTHTFPILFSKLFFSNFFWLLSSIFEFPFSRYVSPYFFRRFDLFSHFLLHGTSFHLLQGLVNILLRSKVHGGMNLTLYYFCVTPIQCLNLNRQTISGLEPGGPVINLSGYSLLV